MSAINIPSPQLQIDFALRLNTVRNTYLQDALFKTVETINLNELNLELSDLVPEDQLKALAGKGLRGELVFPVPCVIKKNPFLLGYYRLLLGFSQKEFYTTQFGLSGYKPCEDKGIIPLSKKNDITDLCMALIKCSVALVNGIDLLNISIGFLDDLTLLTVGPQLRGGANVRKGIDGIRDVFDAILDIVKDHVISRSQSHIVILNAAKRKVHIEFAADPDIVIKEEMSNFTIRNIIAIEVKGGTDFSNIHNRVGEAEKSHQKAKAYGYIECWTVVNVDRIDLTIAKQESPTTNSFYRISAIKSREGLEYIKFRENIVALTGIISN